MSRIQTNDQYIIVSCGLAAVFIFKGSFLSPGLNEELVQLLLIRDELHTEQDAMLVDIEDLTRSVWPSFPKEIRGPGDLKFKMRARISSGERHPLLPGVAHLE